MTRPADCNWYGGGFFDVQINGRPSARRSSHSLSGRSSEGRGTVDFILTRPRPWFACGSSRTGRRLPVHASVAGTQGTDHIRAGTRALLPLGVCHDGRTPCADVGARPQTGRTADLDVANEWWTSTTTGSMTRDNTALGQTGVGPLRDAVGALSDGESRLSGWHLRHRTDSI